MKHWKEDKTGIYIIADTGYWRRLYLLSEKDDRVNLVYNSFEKPMPREEMIEMLEEAIEWLKNKH